MVVETRGLGAVKVLDVWMLGVGLSIGKRPGITNASDANGRKYLDTDNIRRIDVDVGLASTGIVGGKGSRDHFPKWSELKFGAGSAVGDHEMGGTHKPHS